MCALAIGSRVVGVVWPLVSLGYVLGTLFFKKSEEKYTAVILKRSLWFLLFLLLFTFVLWPVLWENPVTSFLHSFNSMKKFRWYGEMLYMGDMVRSTAIPWHYIPVWMVVTTPITFFVFFGIGFVSIAVNLVRFRQKAFIHPGPGMDVVVLAMLLLPLLAVILFGSVLYNGWRHLYFIYPFFVYVGVGGLYHVADRFHRMWKTKSLRWLVIVFFLLIGVDLGQTVYFLVRNHPHQSVYFNVLAGDVEHNFERDYYGVSYRQALTELLKTNPSDTLKIYSRDFIGRINTMNFTKQEAGRIDFVNTSDEADYYISLFNFRNKPEWREFLERSHPFDLPVVLTIKVKDL